MVEYNTVYVNIIAHTSRKIYNIIIARRQEINRNIKTQTISASAQCYRAAEPARGECSMMKIVGKNSDIHFVEMESVL